MKKIINYIKLISITIISIFSLIYILIIVTGSRTSGIGYGITFGLFIGNLIYSLLCKESLKKRILLWLIASFLMSVLLYFSINYLPLNNDTIRILLAYLPSLILAWEIAERLLKKVK